MVCIEGYYMYGHCCIMYTGVVGVSLVSMCTNFTPE